MNVEKPDLNSMSEDQFIEEISRWPALLDKATMRKFESNCQDHSHGVHRRILLMMLTMDSEDMFEACEKEPEELFAGFRVSASTLCMYKRLVKLMDIGHHRLMVALCGIDCDAPDAPFSRKEFFHAIHVAEAKDEEEADEWIEQQSANIDITPILQKFAK